MNRMKRNKTSVKLTIYDLAHRVFFLLLILRDNVENGNKKSLNIKKSKMLWSETGKFEEKY